MKILLDTVTFLWIVEGSDRLSTTAIEGGLTILTPDDLVHQYPVTAAW